MDSSQLRTGSVQGGYLNSKAMIVGLALLTAGGVLGAWGMGIGGTAMARNFRRWLNAQQQSASAYTRQKTVPVKAASATSSNGLRKETATSSAAR
jgi:hypothetical protein